MRSPRSTYRLNGVLWIFALCLFTQSRTGAECATWTVGPGGGFDFSTVGAALAASVNGDVVTLADGVYSAESGETFPLLLKTGVSIRAATPGAKPVVEGDGVNRVMALSDVRGVLLERITVRGGESSVGGGLSVSGSSVVVRDCTFESNHAIANAGGMHLTNGSSGMFERCVLQSNRSETFGGGLTIDQGSNFRFVDCLFRENYSGAVQCSGTAPRFVRCRFLANRGRIGGAVACFAANPRFIDCVFADNAADIGTLGGGGAIFLTSSSPLFLGCIVAANRSTEDAGAVLCDSGSSPRFQNCVIAGNSCVERAGAVGCTIQSNPQFVNCIAVGNRGTAGGLLFTSSSGPEFANCVIRDNTATIGPWISTEDPDLGGTASTVLTVNSIVWNGTNSVSNLDSSTITVLQSQIEDTLPGPGNDSSDPGFIPHLSGTWTSAPLFDGESRTTRLTDAAAGFGPPDSLANRKLTLSVGPGHPVHFVVAGNSETTLEVWGDATQETAIGLAYQLFDYRLQPNSPCIDSGSDDLFGPPSDIGWTYGDADDQARKADGDGDLDSSIDRGAFEFGSTSPVADLNRDLVVDFLDLFTFQHTWRSSTGAQPGLGDLNGDDGINANDLLILTRNLNLE